jgi:uncharacterized linocin/CFP29 family protein
MDLLKKELAPITAEAWAEINSEAQRVFNTILSARKFVDVEGPLGWDLGAVNTGRLNVADKQDGNVSYGIAQVQPMIESRVQFNLNIWELDNVIRGAENIDLDPLRDAAKEIAKFEEKVIYQGHNKANITGLQDNSDYENLKLPANAEDWLKIVSSAIAEYKKNGVGGPFSLIVPSDKWEDIANTLIGGHTLLNIIQNTLSTSVISAPLLENEAFLIAEQPGSFRLTLGGDLSIGYEKHDAKEVQLFLAESFTFQVIDPSAVMVVK